MKYLFLSILMLNFSGVFSQDSISSQLRNLDFENINASIVIVPESGKVQGEVVYQFEVLNQVDSVYLDAQKMEFSEVKVNGKSIPTNNTGNVLWLKTKLKPSEANEIRLSYSAKPQQAMYFINWDVPEKIPASRQVWTQGQGKNSSNWIPVIDNLNEKAVYDLSIDFKKDYEVISNGELASVETLNDSVSRWNFQMQKPMSSYLLAVAAGKFQKEELKSASGVPMELYLEEDEDSLREPSYRYSKEIFDFLEDEIGVPYPWQNYKQVPVQDFLYAGMENTGATIFSRALLTDEVGFKDRNYVNVNAHELAHQWFGNLVTQEAEEHHWLHEGFATYYALLAEKEIFGDNYYYWKLYEWAERLKELSDTGKGEVLMRKGGSSLTYYQKGAWALHILREKVGDEAFKTAVRNYLELYAYQNVNTDNFIAEVERASGQDLSGFIADWLKQTAFQGTDALNSLKQSEFIRNYLDIAALRESPLEQKSDLLRNALQKPVNDYIGQEVVFQLAGETSTEAFQLYKLAFQSENIFVRQAIALSMDEIPQQLKPDYESLLHDESWLTIEAALTNLWMQFPQENTRYLHETRGLIGFTDRNLRILWLTLNLATPAFEPEKQQENYMELSGYTAPHFPFEVRKNAFGYLFQINAFSDENLRNLMEATQHHNNQFRSFSRELLSELLKNPDYRRQLEMLNANLPEQERLYLLEKLES
ncbi:MAG: M1 family metallopeptidase [Salegentibacter sp.]|uniref:M1 family metallopeptidase n=1 Tax=Salegentibacter sp. TaxID=1903072 RepID=UPI00286FB70F|nr:M1 family metallopeptidase [Salegentibacter sp.]MDR9456916.1 M1 family metallopeptidase [Salegentibacter sp.]